MICPHCKNEIDPDSRLCPYCGENPHFRETNKNAASTAVKILAAVLLVVIGIVIGYGVSILSWFTSKPSTTVSSSVSFTSNKGVTGEQNTTSDVINNIDKTFHESSTYTVENSSKSPETTTKALIDPNEQVVYVTKSGKKYHNEGCYSLGEEIYALRISEAKSLGYEPCENCKPDEGTSVKQTTSQTATFSTISQISQTTAEESKSASSTVTESTKTTEKPTTTKATTTSEVEETTKKVWFYVPKNQPDEGIVYYHRKGCKYLDESSFALTESELEEDGSYTPCPHCIKN